MKKKCFGHAVAKAAERTPSEIPQSQWATAIFQSFGNRSALAKLLKVNPTSLRTYLDSHPELKQLMQQAREALVDTAEEYVANVLKNEAVDTRTRTQLAMFVLKTQGRDRGWSDAPQIATQVNISTDAEKRAKISMIFGIPDNDAAQES